MGPCAIYDTLKVACPQCSQLHGFFAPKQCEQPNCNVTLPRLHSFCGWSLFSISCTASFGGPMHSLENFKKICPDLWPTRTVGGQPRFLHLDVNTSRGKHSTRKP